ncbi:MAG: prepilin-type N-terminal cleavage/methylation domain-containing protein [Patescibacteria group bacterium]|nr:prepilin-type N-terminal cleavage/methylation domain-containing protein [Patescibacteria group bacterium]
MKTTTRKGFTLVEMAVVLLIIGILAGIVLRNIGSFSPQARDTRRVADLQVVSTYLAQYLNNKGYFPQTTTWDGLETELRSIGVYNIPKDPAGLSYSYYYCTTTGADKPNHFVLRATLESATDSKIYENSYNNSNPPSGWNCNGPATFNCSTNNARVYCLIQ